MTKSKARGQSLVEFALIIPLFLALMVGLLDGTRLLFTYNELQEAARVGARWGAINVGRDNWGNLRASLGSNVAGTSYPLTSYPVAPSGSVTSTIAEQVASKLVGIDHTAVNLTVSTPITLDKTDVYTEDTLAGLPVTIKVEYTFTPVISFGHFGIKLAGKSIQYHA